MLDERTARVVGRRYVLHEVLGRGGMGQVWRGEDSLLHRPVAVKELHLPPALSDDELERARSRALREARAAARLSSVGSVAVYDAVEEGNQVFLVMELVEGPTLSDAVARDGPLDPEAAAQLGLRLLDALEEAHRCGIVHRDVKPSNVMLTGPTAKLADFGIASVADDPSMTTTANKLIGSPSYMAPEQARGEGATPATDLWGLGATLYFAVEGVRPFDGGEAMATLAAVVHQPHRPPVRAGRLAPVIDALLAKDPAARPSVAEARAALLASPVPASPASTPRKPQTQEREGRRTTRVLPLLVAALVVAVVAAMALWPEPESGEERTATTPAAAVPAGWETYTNEAAGYRISHPPGWQQEQVSRTAVDFEDPGSSAYLRVDWVAPPGPDAAAAWMNQERSFRTRHPDYQRIRIEPTTYNGMDGAVWEYMFRGMHAVNLGFVTDQRGYALNLVAPESGWAEADSLFEQFKGSFRLTATR